MTTYRVSRHGEVKLTAALDRHADGTLWTGGSHPTPLLDAEAAGFIAMGKDTIVALVKAGQFDRIPADCYAREGVSASGMEVKSYDDIRKEARAAMTPAQVERERISGLYAKAARRRDAEDDDNTGDYYAIRAEADTALHAWRETYPREAALEDADKLDAEAAHEEDMARGALVYDCDGSLSAEDQQRRHDEYMGKAAALRKQAAELRK